MSPHHTRTQTLQSRTSKYLVSIITEKNTCKKVKKKRWERGNNAHNTEKENQLIYMKVIYLMRLDIHSAQTVSSNVRIQLLQRVQVS